MPLLSRGTFATEVDGRIVDQQQQQQQSSSPCARSQQRSTKPSIVLLSAPTKPWFHRFAT
jgi:hypothetical protein